MMTQQPRTYYNKTLADMRATGIRETLEMQCRDLSESFKFYKENAEILKDRVMFIRYEVKKTLKFLRIILTLRHRHKLICGGSKCRTDQITQKKFRNYMDSLLKIHILRSGSPDGDPDSGSNFNF
jgi:hypothetical protein